MTATNNSASAVRARGARLGARLYGPINRAYRSSAIGAALGAAVSLALGLAIHDPFRAGLAGLAVALVGFAAGWWRILDPDLRAALELVSDHDCHERAEWKRETGTSVPIGVAAMRRWLVTHPSGPGRASVLLRMGQLEEADRAIDAIDAIEASTPEEAFSVDVLRQTRILLAGETPDSSPLHASWRVLPDGRERRHRRECLALLDAQIAVAGGRDPVPALALARHEIGAVHPSMRARRLLGRLFLIAAGVIGVAAILGSAVSF
jgi:hypothetical protein